MQRRSFIKNVSAMALAAGTGLYSCNTPSAQQAPSKIRWAMGWLLWRDFENREIPLKEALHDLHDLGLDGIEFTPRPGELEKQGFTQESLMELLNELNLRVSGHYFSAPFHDSTKKDEISQDLQTRIDSIKAFGGRNIIIGPPGIPASGENHLDLIKSMAPLLNELGKNALDQGVEIGLHPHLNTIVETPQEIHAAMEATDPRYVFMSPDTGHIYLGGGNVVDILRTYQDRLNYFHFKDGAGTFTRPDFFPNMRELGNGEVDFPAVMQLLNDIGYTGWINVEQDFTSQTPRKSAEQSMEYINKQLKPILRS